MDPSLPRLPHDGRPRRVALLAASGFILAAWIFDIHLLGTWSLQTLAIRLVWAGLLVLCALGRPRFRGLFAGLSSTLALLVLAWMTGGSSSPYFVVAAFLPLLVALVEPDDRTATRATAAGTILGSVLLLALEHAGLEPSPDPLSLLKLAAFTSVPIFFSWWALFWQGHAIERRQALVDSEVERLRAEEEAAAADRRRDQAERLALIGKLASSVAHEITNPLSYVRSNLEWIAQTSTDKAIQDVANESLQGTSRMEDFVGDLRGLARDPEVEGKPFLLSEVVAEAMRLASVPLRSVRHIDLALPPDLPRLCTQRTRVVQILVNLLVNAAEAVAERPDARLLIRASTCNDRLELAVEDDGPGIPPEIAPRIFEPFFSTKRGMGTGIGLTICRDAARLLQGELALAPSTLGGACFVLRLPLAPALAHRSAA